MDTIIKTTRRFYRTNKDQIFDFFRTDEKKGKMSSLRMGWFHASGTVELLNVR